MIDLATYSSPFGLLEIGAYGPILVMCDWMIAAGHLSSIKRLEALYDGKNMRGGSATIELACAQLDDYFAGKRREFNLLLNPDGSEYFRKVAEIMKGIPYGATMTYAEIAILMDSGPRGVGAAVKSNIISIFVPCHRVVGTAAMGGYRGGAAAKEGLLQLEADVHRNL